MLRAERARYALMLRRRLRRQPVEYWPRQHLSSLPITLEYYSRRHAMTLRVFRHANVATAV